LPQKQIHQHCSEIIPSKWKETTGITPQPQKRTFKTSIQHPYETWIQGASKHSYRKEFSICRKSVEKQCSHQYTIEASETWRKDSVTEGDKYC